MMESILASPAIKVIGTILLIFLVVAVSIFDNFRHVQLEDGTRWFWIKAVLLISAILALVCWLILIVTGK
jgi:hypothetical protein